MAEIGLIPLERRGWNFFFPLLWMWTNDPGTNHVLCHCAGVCSWSGRWKWNIVRKLDRTIKGSRSASLAFRKVSPLRRLVSVRQAPSSFALSLLRSQLLHQLSSSRLLETDPVLPHRHQQIVPRLFRNNISRTSCQSFHQPIHPSKQPTPEQLADRKVSFPATHPTTRLNAFASHSQSSADTQHFVRTLFFY